MMTSAAVFHLSLALHFWFACYYDWAFVHIPDTVYVANNKTTIPHTSFGGKMKYLTYWNALIQAIHFTVCFLNDITNDDPSKETVLSKLKNWILSVLAFPLSMFVGTTFWGLYMYDRELIFPKALDSFFPGWLNHVMHTNIMVFAVTELASTFRLYPARKRGVTGLSIFMAIYVVWVHYINYRTDVWVYPILQVLNPVFRSIFFVFLYLFCLGFYIAGEKLNNSIWSKEIEQAKSTPGFKTSRQRL